MSHVADTVRARAARVVVLVIVLAAACLVGVAAPAADAGSRDDRPRRWVGYPIPADGDAAGGWIGGYRVGGKKLFLTTPTRNPNRAGYAAQQEVEDVPGRTASRAETARAAWILSKYGAYRDATQAAAVDASVYHLLVGGPWRTTGPRGARRIRQSGDRASVARFARIMLRQSRASAGRYSASLTAAATDVGGAVGVTLSVTDGHGRPAAGLPVALTMSGVAPVSAVTGDDGRAVARFAAQMRGWQDVSATVSQVPEHRLHAWAAKKGRQASAAEGGVRRTLVASTRAAVRGPQTLSMTASPSTAIVGTPIRVVGKVSGDRAPRTGTATFHGPFMSAAEADCSVPAAATVILAVEGDGDYAWPAVTPGAGGYYAWRIAVDGTDTNVPISACGAVVKVRGRATVALAAPGTAAVYGVVSAQVTVAGLPFGRPVDLTTTLDGPYATAAEITCTGNHRDVTQHQPDGNGTFTSLSVQVVASGWYAWRSAVPEGDLWLGATSACGVVGSVTQVQ